MEVPASLQIRIAKHIMRLAQLSDGNEAILKDLYEVCVVINDCVQDEYSIARDLMEYIEECWKMAAGRGDERWRDELLETLQDDIDRED
ncbi:hypothetical protein IPM09_01375 [Candidatus Saccharibacteria bacterium]|nr:MAG: hypothetical protein IPM09_01375 [Candidatus Saccharibacteria bacterium]